ncbi:MAG: inorganic diphosphatase [Chloroflexota bacterium]|nr:MAG: inorganic diphosphatase [Chloroflexota bacterium]
MAANNSAKDAEEHPLIQVFIQVEAGSRERNLYDEKTLEHKGTRRTLLPYPYPYGFIVGTTAADGDNVDCYVITEDHLKAGTIVECVPVGLLEQEEDGEADHKVLAAVPGQAVTLNQELLDVFRVFIYSVFAQFPGMSVRVGRILPEEQAWRFIRGFEDS